MPVLAVMAGGRPSVSCGSTSATRGSKKALRKLTLMFCAGTDITALRVTSAPVPAVVGTAMQATAGFASGCPPPATST